jgi:hypothetical protein
VPVEVMHALQTLVRPQIVGDGDGAHAHNWPIGDRESLQQIYSLSRRFGDPVARRVGDQITLSDLRPSAPVRKYPPLWAAFGHRISAIATAHIGTLCRYRRLVGQPGSSAVALRRVAGRLHLDQAVPEYERVDAVFGESRWKSCAWMAASMAPSDRFLIGAGQARVGGL